jgi:hypothetical protein
MTSVKTQSTGWMNGAARDPERMRKKSTLAPVLAGNTIAELGTTRGTVTSYPVNASGMT